MEGSPALISIISPPFWISTPTLCLPSSKNWTKRMLCLNLDRMDLLELNSGRRWFRRPNIKTLKNVHGARTSSHKLRYVSGPKISTDRPQVTQGALLSTKTFENLETAVNGTENSRKSFQKFRNLLNFRNTNHSTGNSTNSGSNLQWKENFWEKIFDTGYTSRGFLAWISSDYLESLLLPQLRGENDLKQSDEIQATPKWIASR